MKYENTYGVIHLPSLRGQFILDIYAVDGVQEDVFEDPDEILNGYIFDTVEQLEEYLKNECEKLTNFDALIEEINDFKKGQS